MSVEMADQTNLDEAMLNEVALANMEGNSTHDSSGPQKKKRKASGDAPGQLSKRMSPNDPTGDENTDSYMEGK
jgi:hypothetical protein